MRKVYSYSNISDVFATDREIVRKLYNYISDNLCTTLNPNKSRTKEIALKRLQADMDIYRNQLGNI